MRSQREKLTSSLMETNDALKSPGVPRKQKVVARSQRLLPGRDDEVLCLTADVLYVCVQEEKKALNTNMLPLLC